ncbi:serine/threonine protein kinase [Scytonema hofmannii FACHB-248]|uniref:non-specific serine/threonine protein kinase n=1 Tax=Scytonema hofmannii FACHB-248 TaxID=1842502 RepID=A0ABR8GWU8_9CYAN|nr:MULTISPECIES: serine/threonine-protein kinase [Nostocales]MBD2607213.1 serine/threonine protein kinase [Scytonema hofmannii FACHB-248]
MKIGTSNVHCINPDCQRPYPQLWGQKFCNSCGATLQLLDRYIPLERLGSGGFAQIYTVWDEKSQTEKVLKVLIENSAKALELFTQEAAVLSSLRHPGVPKVDKDGNFEIDLSNPQPRKLACLVMEKIDGLTLEEILEQYPQGCPEKLVLSWLTQTVEILQELHKRQILHRDIKPSNLMLRTFPATTLLNKGGVGESRLVLIDFGGAKQFNEKILRSQSGSTRLFSSGYSPPEQVVGGNVGPGTDFYALGRTMIELLTGKYPPKLEDPQTGELRWRGGINLNPELGDLLSEMVEEDVRSRPTSSTIILKRLAQISQPPQPDFFAIIMQAIRQAIADFTQAISKTTLFIIQTIFRVFGACVMTIWTMVLSCIGAGVGTIAGYILAYHTILGDRVGAVVSQRLLGLIPNTNHFFGSEIILFATAGLGTAWGLTLAGGFGQQRRFIVASMMGIIGYGFSWLMLQLITPQDGIEASTISILIAVFVLTLGLGLRSHHIVYAAIASGGTAIVFALLISFGFSPTAFLFHNTPNQWSLLLTILFFSLAGLFVSFWLAVSHYLIVPGLRFLGWR